MAYSYITANRLTRIIQALMPRFAGRDQDHLVALADEAAGAGYDAAYTHIQPLEQFKTDLQSTAGASLIGSVGPSHVQTDIDNLNAALALKANINSPTFTGDPKAPTPATSDNDTSIATTAYVKAQGYGTGTVTSVGAIGSTGLSISGSPITTSGSITYTLSANLQAWSGIATSAKVSNAGDSMTGILSHFIGGTGTQQIFEQFGWNNSIARWKNVIETGATYAMYGYDTSGFTPTKILELSTSVAGGTDQVTVNGHLLMSGTSRRIMADMSNATHASRMLFQSSTVNGNTVIGAIPNGTATISAVQMYNNSDPNNAGVLQFRMDPTLCIYNSMKTGTGVTRNMSFQFDGAEKAVLDTLGNFTARDHVASRGDGTGVIFLNAALTRYLYFDGTVYKMPGANLEVDGTVISGVTGGVGQVGSSAGSNTKFRYDGYFSTDNGTTYLEIGYRNIPRVTGGFSQGKMYAISSGVTVGTSNTGDTFSVYNDSASAVTLTQGGGLTLRLAGTATTGNRTLAARGIATLWFNSASECIISGPGVT